MPVHPTLTAQRLREVVAYEPETGVFTRRRPRGTCPAGGEAGHVSVRDGYSRVGVDGTLHLAHRLAWLYVHGEWPAGDIDHRNGDRADNRLTNLRVVTRGQNLQNRKRPAANRPAGSVLGVSAKRNRWRARIVAGGREISLGSFTTQEEAAAAYRSAKRELHPYWDEVV